jgi:hypothetical protein
MQTPFVRFYLCLDTFLLVYRKRKGNAIAFPFLLAGAEGFEKSCAKRQNAVSRGEFAKIGSESFCKVPLAILAVLWYNKKKGAAFSVSILQKENVK